MEWLLGQKLNYLIWCLRALTLHKSVHFKGLSKTHAPGWVKLSRLPGDFPYLYAVCFFWLEENISFSPALSLKSK